jgi:hypothetical protein
MDGFCLKNSRWMVSAKKIALQIRDGKSQQVQGAFIHAAQADPKR